MQFLNHAANLLRAAITRLFGTGGIHAKGGVIHGQSKQWPPSCCGAREVARRLRQIQRGRLQCHRQ